MPYKDSHPHYRELIVDNLRLREPDIADAQASLSWVKSKEVVQYMGIEFDSPTLEGEQKRIREILSNPDEINWMIMDGDVCIGNVSLNSIEETSKKLGKRSANLAILIGNTHHWGKGIATRVCTTVLDWAFAEAKFEAIAARAVWENLGSIKTLQRLGFKEMETKPFDGLVDGRKSMWRNFLLEAISWGQSQ